MKTHIPWVFIKNIATGETSPVITPFHFFDYYNFSNFYHLITFILDKVYHKILDSFFAFCLLCLLRLLRLLRLLHLLRLLRHKQIKKNLFEQWLLFQMTGFYMLLCTVAGVLTLSAISFDRSSDQDHYKHRKMLCTTPHP